MRLICISAANSVCGAPKPRKAPFGGVLVAIARPVMRTFGHRYGPPACSIAAREHHRRERAVRAAVHDDLDLLGDQLAGVAHAGPIAHHGRVTLGGGADVLVAVVDHAHRLAALQRQQRRVEGDDRGVLLLAAEAAAGLGLDHDRQLVAHVERSLHRLVDVVRALQRAVDGHPAVLARDGDHRLVLDVQLLLVADAVGALDHELGVLHGRRGVTAPRRCSGRTRAPTPAGRRRPAARSVRRRDVAPGLAQGGAVRRRDERAGLGLVPDLAADRDEDRLVVVDQADDVLAGDVLGGDDHDALPVERVVELDAEQARVRLGRADGGAVPGAGEDEVVGVQRRPGELGRALAAQRRRGSRAAGRRRVGRDDQRRRVAARRRGDAGRQRAGGQARALHRCILAPSRTR